MAYPRRAEAVVTQTPATPVTGLVLAGGQGRRMQGADKGWVYWHGRPLIEHVLARLRPQVDALLISANRNLPRYRALGYAVVEDDHTRLGAYSGPLAGIYAGLQGVRTPWLAVVPCDAPALPLDLVGRLLAAARAAQAPAVAVCAQRREPVFCLLPRSAAASLAAALQAGVRRPADFLAAAGAVEVCFDDAAAFLNLNLPVAGIALTPEAP